MCFNVILIEGNGKMKQHVLTLAQIENTNGTKYGACEKCHRPYRLGHIATKHLRNTQTDKYTLNGPESFVCWSCSQDMKHKAITTFFCTSEEYIRDKFYDAV